MKTINRNIAFLILILTTLLFLEGERVLIYSNSEFYDAISQNQVNDVESPTHHHNCFDSFEDETWFSSKKINISDCYNLTSKVLIPYLLVPKELPSSIWQPPKLG